MLVEAHYFDQCVNVGVRLCTCPLQDKKGDLIDPEVEEPKVKFLQLHVLRVYELQSCMLAEN